jgi:hypothetical protein
VAGVTENVIKETANKIKKEKFKFSHRYNIALQVSVDRKEQMDKSRNKRRPQKEGNKQQN